MSAEEVCESGSILHPFNREKLTPPGIKEFQDFIYAFYRAHRREFPWRTTTNPYHIVVSEIMLQQTQVDRVVQKYEPFIRAFPDFHELAHAPLRAIITLWQGLGYNRRAVYLRQIAGKVVSEFGGVVPQDPAVLKTWPGIGAATAASICAFAFNKPVTFIETNIRSVFLHLFFAENESVSDAMIGALVEKTLDRTDARAWYSALMDYGAHLKKQLTNPGRKSSHYKTQAPFEGSNRKVRGAIIRFLSINNSLSFPQLQKLTGSSRDCLDRNVRNLKKEGLVKEREGRYFI